MAAWVIMTNPYPITRNADYNRSQHSCDLEGKPIKPGFDSHYVLVDQEPDGDYQACRYSKTKEVPITIVV